MSKDKVLKINYSKREKDLIFHYPTGSWEAAMLMEFFHYTKDINDRTLKQALEQSEFDITTLKFSIKKKVK